MADQTIKLTFSEEMELSYLNLVSDKISKDISNVRLQSLSDSMSIPELVTVSSSADVNESAPAIVSAEKQPETAVVSAPSFLAPAAEIGNETVSEKEAANESVIPQAEQQASAPIQEPEMVFMPAAEEPSLSVESVPEPPENESVQDVLMTSTGPTIESITGYDVEDPFSVTVNVTLSGPGSESATTYYTVNGSPWTEFTGSFILTENCQFMVKAEDMAGNQTWSDVLNVTKIGFADNEGPTIESITGYDAASSDYVTIDVAVSDSGSGVAGTYYRFNGAEWKSFSGSFTVTDNGPFMIMAEDNAGNRTRSEVLYVKNISKSESGGIVQVYSGGVPVLTQSSPLIDYFLSGSAYQMQVFSGGETVSLTMTDSSVATLNSAGAMTETYVSGNAILVLRGGISERNMLEGNGKMLVSDGVAISNTVTGTGASLEVSSGGRASSTIVSDSGYLVMRGGTAAGNTISDNGGLLVYDGTAVSTYISGSNARLEAASFGQVSGAALVDGGTAVLRNGGQMISGQVLSSGLLFVSSAGEASAVSIQSGGVAAFQSGAVASSVHVTDGAQVFVSHGATVTGLTPDGSSYLLQIGIDSTTNVQLISSGIVYSIINGQMDSAVAYAGTYLEVEAGGCVQNLRTSGYLEPLGSGAGGAMQISAGGSGYNIENHLSGQINVFSGGYLSGAVTDTWGEIYIGNSKIGSGITKAGGSADDLRIDSDGFLWIHSGGIVSGIQVNMSGKVTVSSGAHADDVTISGGHVIVEESNAYISNVEIDEGGILQICGAHAENVTILSGGILTYSSSFYPMDVDVPVIALSGQASNVTVSSGGVLAAKYTGSATNVLVLDGGTVQVSSGTLVQSMIAASGADVFIESQGVVLDATVSGGLFAVKEYASAVNVLAMTGAEIQVHNAASLEDFRINSGAYAVISEGGLLNSATVSSSGRLDIDAGADAHDLTISQGATVNIVYISGMQLDGSVKGASFTGDGETLSGYTVLNSGHLNMIDGFGRNLIASEGGRINISSGASARDMTVSSAGICYVYGNVSSLITNLGETHFSDTGYGYGITVAGGYAQIHDGAVTDTVTVNNSATLIVKTGGLASNVTISSGGLLAAVSGGSADSVHALAGADVQASSGALVQNVTVDSGAHVYIDSQGQVQTATVSGGGLFAVRQNGSAVNVLALADAETQVQSGGYIEDFRINSGAYAVISGGGQLNNATVSSGGRLDIDAGADAHDLIVNLGAVVNIVYASGMQLDGTVNTAVFSGSEDTLSGYTVLNSGHLNMQTGFGQDLRVSQGGRINIFSGASAQDVTVNSAGICYVYGYVSSLITNLGETHFSDTGFGCDITVAGGYAQVHDDAVIDVVTVNNSATLITRNGGIANNVTISSGGLLAALTGGSATNVIALAGADVQVSSGAFIQNLDLGSGAHTYVESMGQVQAATVSGLFAVKGYASAQNVSGLANAEIQVLSNGYLENLYLEADAYTVISGGGQVNLATVSYGGRLDLLSGAAAHNLNVESDGLVNINYTSGMQLDGTVNTAVFSGSEELLSGYTVLSGGHLNMITGSGQDLTVSEGGVINISGGASVQGVIVAEAGSCTVFGAVSGMVTGGDTHFYTAGIGSAITVTGAYTQVHAGGFINQATVGNGAVIVYAGGSAADVTMTSGGVLAVNGSASDVKVSSGGQTQVNENGSVSQLQLFDGGYSVIAAGTGSVDGAEVASGAQLDVYSGVLQNANISGRLNILAAGSAHYVTVDSGAVCNINGTVSNVTTYGDINFNSGATVSSVEVMGNFAEVNSGAVVDNMNLIGGQVIVYAGGTVHDLTLAGTTEGDIFTGGAVYGLNTNYFVRMQSGARLGGEINLTDTGRVFANEGAVVEFSLVGRSASANYLINNLSRIQWSPSYAISVSSDQAVGTYKLAQGVASFTGSMMVMVDDVNVGSIACNGSFSYGGYTYTLNKSSIKNELTFGVSLAAASPSCDESCLLPAESAAVLDLGQDWQELSQPGIVDSLALDSSDYSDEISSLLGMQYSEGMTAYYACGDLPGWNETSSILDKNRSLIA